MILAKQWPTKNNIYERVLLEAGKETTDLVVIDADLARASQTKLFMEKFPSRYFDVGIAEQNMTGIAAGFALSGRPVIISTFAVFLSKRACDQVSVSIAYTELNVKLLGIEAGLSSGRNGATHQAVEDIAIMRSMPNMVVMAPLDVVEIRAAVKAAIAHQGPVYMRMRRGETPVIFDDDYDFRWGKGVMMREGADVTIVSTGIMTEEALLAADMLAGQGVDASVCHLHTIKPLDEALIVECAQKTGALVTAENHSILGGLGSAVAEVLCEKCPAPMTRIGIRDLFGETGSPEYLFKKYRLTPQDIAEGAMAVINRKTSLR